MILYKRSPSLRWWLPFASAQQSRHGPLGDYDAKFEQFAVNLGGTPERIGIGHLENQRPHIRIQRGPPTFASLGLPTPVELEGPLMPAYDGIWLHNQKGVSPSRPGTRHDHPEQSVALLEFGTILSPLEHDELLAECDVLCGQVCDDIELSGEPTTAVFDDLEHH